MRDKYGCELLLHPYYFIDRQIISHGCYEPALHDYLEKTLMPGMVCLDVGATIGSISLHMGRKVGQSGRVLCFEPVPQLAGRLEVHVTRNRLSHTVEVHRVALTNNAGEAEMRLAPPSHANQGMASLVEHEHHALTEGVIVRCATLDGYLRGRSLSRLDFIKVDIQGAEPSFIAGAEQTLRRFRPRVAMEVAPSSLNASGGSSDMLVRSMEQLKYQAWRLGRGGAPGSAAHRTGLPARLLGRQRHLCSGGVRRRRLRHADSILTPAAVVRPKHPWRPE